MIIPIETWLIPMMYRIKLSFMIQILLVFTCEVQTSNADKNQRNLLRESFQKALMNDSEQLLILQQVFLIPRQKDPSGVYLHVDVTVDGRITESDDDHSHLIDEYCDNYLCVYHTSMKFEILPPAADQDSSVKTFLNKLYIRIVLQVLDPSFHTLADVLQSLDDYYDIPNNPDWLNLYTHVDEVEIVLDELSTDVLNAVYLALSWVSLS